jgi:hypothetical protein
MLDWWVKERREWVWKGARFRRAAEVDQGH